MNDVRPPWTQETPEELARWLVAHTITKITHHWEFTGEDTARNWIEVHTADGAKRSLESRFLNNSRDFEFAPDHAALVRPRNYSKVRENIELIDKWEKSNAKDRSDYERLKRKFG